MSDRVSNVVPIGKGIAFERNDGTERWDGIGWVCAECGVPVESEPCDKHYPEITDFRVHQWKTLFDADQGTLCGVSAHHHIFKKYRMVQMDANPNAITCGDCRYLMQKIEGGPIHVW